MAKFSDNSLASIVWDNTELTLGTLGSQTAISTTSRIDAGRLQGFRVLRTEYFVIMRGATVGDDPVVFGLCHDLSNAEIAETFGADPQRPGDPGLEEMAMRPVWVLGSLAANNDGDGRVVLDGVKKLGWSIQEGTPLKWFAFNHGPGALSTGGEINILAKHFGVWLKD